MRKLYWGVFIVFLVFIVLFVIANTNNDLSNEENILNIMSIEEVQAKNITTSINKINGTDLYEVVVTGVITPQKDFKDFDVNITLYHENGTKFERSYNAFNETQANAFQRYDFKFSTEEYSKPYKMILEVYGGDNKKTPLLSEEFVF